MDKEESRQILGAKIKEIRESKGISKYEVSKKSGVVISNLTRIEAGKYSVGFDILQRIAEALGCKIELSPII